MSDVMEPARAKRHRDSFDSLDPLTDLDPALLAETDFPRSLPVDVARRVRDADALGESAEFEVRRTKTRAGHRDTGVSDAPPMPESMRASQAHAQARAQTDSAPESASAGARPSYRVLIKIINVETLLKVVKVTASRGKSMRVTFLTSERERVPVGIRMIAVDDLPATVAVNSHFECSVRAGVDASGRRIDLASEVWDLDSQLFVRVLEDTCMSNTSLRIALNPEADTLLVERAVQRGCDLRRRRMGLLGEGHADDLFNRIKDMEELQSIQFDLGILYTFMQAAIRDKAPFFEIRCDSYESHDPLLGLVRAYRTTLSYRDESGQDSDHELRQAMRRLADDNKWDVVPDFEYEPSKFEEQFSHAIPTKTIHKYVMNMGTKEKFISMASSQNHPVIFEYRPCTGARVRMLVAPMAEVE